MRFFGKEEYPVHRPDFRSALASATKVNLGSPLPESVLDSNRGGVVLFGYPGREVPLDVSPAMAGLVKFADLVSVSETSRRCRVSVVVRENYIDGLDSNPYASVLEREGLTLQQALDPLVIKVTKGRDGRYHAGFSEGKRMAREIRSGGLVAIAPGESTDKFGLPGCGYRSSGVRLAVEQGCGLYTLAIETVGSRPELVAKAIHVRKIDLPTITYQRETRRLARRLMVWQEERRKEKEVRQRGNLAVTHYGMAVIASCLPEGRERGDFQDPPLEMRNSVQRLKGLRDEGLRAVGGFMEDERIFRY